MLILIYFCYCSQFPKLSIFTSKILFAYDHLILLIALYQLDKCSSLKIAIQSLVKEIYDRGIPFLLLAIYFLSKSTTLDFDFIFLKPCGIPVKNKYLIYDDVFTSELEYHLTLYSLFLNEYMQIIWALLFFASNFRVFQYD